MDQCNATSRWYAKNCFYRRHPASKSFLLVHETIQETRSAVLTNNETERPADVVEEYEDDILIKLKKISKLP